jgi:hypothetical protein
MWLVIEHNQKPTHFFFPKIGGANMGIRKNPHSMPFFWLFGCLFCFVLLSSFLLVLFLIFPSSCYFIYMLASFVK